jgi:hypothetical protein
VLILTQDGYTVCAKCAIGSEIVLGIADGTPTSNGLSEIFFLFQMEIVLVLVQDRCTVCTECTIGSKIILDPPDGTPT